MKITILAHGSRGDVQPYLALAIGLAQAGHKVRLAAPAIFREMILQAANQEQLFDRLGFATLAGDPARLMQEAAASGHSKRAAWMPGPVKMGLIVLRYVTPVLRQLTKDIRDCCLDADLIIHSLLTTILAHQMALELGIPDLSALVFPVFSPTSAFPNPLFPPFPGPNAVNGALRSKIRGRYNFLTHREFNRVFFLASRLTLQHARRVEPAISAPREWLFPWPDGILRWANPTSPTPVLYGISRHTLPAPPDWRCPCNLTGYWFQDALPGWTPPQNLQRFLDQGDPPVFIGFGSLKIRHSDQMTRIALEALEASGQRGLLLGGWGGLRAGKLPGWAHFVDEVPYDWLFPRVKAAVHHGGVGTAAAAFRAGIPSTVVPYVFDQPFWGRQIHVLGAGPAPISSRQLTSGRLAQAITEMTGNVTMQACAAEIGMKVRAENGVATAVRWVEENLGR